MHEVLVNRLGGLRLPRKSVVRLTDRPDMTLDVYRGRKTTIQQQQQVLDCSKPQEEYLQPILREEVEIAVASRKMRSLPELIIYQQNLFKLAERP